MTQSRTNALPAAFEDLRRQARAARDQGRLDDSADYLEQAIAWAERHGDDRLLDLAFCGWSAVSIELRRGEDTVPRLREVLMRNGDDESCFLAAYTVARSYELRQDYRKALFYARLAKDRAGRLDNPQWLASSHNLMGNLQLAQSYFDEACDEYALALEQLDQEPRLRHALILDNLGYCAIIQGDHRRGFDLLFRSLRCLRRLKAPRYQALPQSALCYAYMEIERWPSAVRHGLAALRLAERYDDRHTIKNCLYLLGEAYHLQGNLLAGRRMFDRLQTEYYPDTEHLADLLSVIDVRSLVNLRA